MPTLSGLIVHAASYWGVIWFFDVPSREALFCYLAGASVLGAAAWHPRLRLGVGQSGQVVGYSALLAVLVFGANGAREVLGNSVRVQHLDGLSMAPHLVLAPGVLSVGLGALVASLVRQATRGKLGDKAVVRSRERYQRENHSVQASQPHHPMFGKVLKHFIAPRAELAAEKLNATLKGQTAIRVLGQNMEPGIPKNTVITYRASSTEERLERGTVVVFAVPEFEGHAVPCRVIATEGDRVRLQGGKLFLNEEHVVEPYVQPGLASSAYSTDVAELMVPAGTCFLLGDYRDASKDSRVLGPIPRNAILGIVLGRMGA